jgi:hypothetical protein
MGMSFSFESLLYEFYMSKINGRKLTKDELNTLIDLLEKQVNDVKEELEEEDNNE